MALLKRYDWKSIHSGKIFAQFTSNPDATRKTHLTRPDLPERSFEFQSALDIFPTINISTDRRQKTDVITDDSVVTPKPTSTNKLFAQTTH
jgi:hypothetical protein